MRKFESLLGFLFTIGIATALLFFVLKYIEVPFGSLVDWMIGFSTAAWLISITTIPWDIYFEAKRVVNDAAISQKKNIPFDEQEVKYAASVAQYALVIAIILHILSAGGLYLLAYYEISVVGYYGCVASLLLTLLRPAVRLYQYVSERLSNIRFEIKYPRDDVKELTHKLHELKHNMDKILQLLDKENEDSWLKKQEKTNEQYGQEIKQLQRNLHNLREQFQNDNEKVLKETQKSIADFKRDGKFVDNFIENLTEIVRFIKKV